MTLDRAALMTLDPLQANAIAVIQAMLDLQTPSGAGGQTIEPALSIEACLIAAAALLETSADADFGPRLAEAGRRFAAIARAFRDEHARGGQTALEQIGGIAVSRTTVQ